MHLFRTIPTSFVPNEDQGYLMGMVMMPDAASLNRTVDTAKRIDELFAKNPAVDSRTMINGYSLIDGQFKPNVSTFFVALRILARNVMLRQSVLEKKMQGPC